MTGVKFLLDTNIVIGLLKQGQSLLLDSDITPDVCAISQITRMELLSFFQLTVEEEQVIKRFIAGVMVIGIDEAVSLDNRKQFTLCQRCDIRRGRITNKNGYRATGHGLFAQLCDRHVTSVKKDDKYSVCSTRISR